MYKNGTKCCGHIDDRPPTINRQMKRNELAFGLAHLNNLIDFGFCACARVSEYLQRADPIEFANFDQVLDFYAHVLPVCEKHKNERMFLCSFFFHHSGSIIKVMTPFILIFYSKKIKIYQFLYLKYYERTPGEDAVFFLSSLEEFLCCCRPHPKSWNRSKGEKFYDAID